MPSAKPSDSTLKVCHLSDINLGYRRYNKVNKNGFNQREADAALAFREALDKIAKLKPQLVLIAGDLFSSVRPSNAVLSQAFAEIKRFKTVVAAPLIIVAGNRESPRRSDTGNPLRILSEIDGVFVVDSKVQVLRFDDLSLSVCAVPHVQVSQALKRGLRADDAVQFNVLVMHGQVVGQVSTESGGATIDLKDITLGEWDYVALGHSHLHKSLAHNVIYSGATERTASNIWGMSNSEVGFVEATLPLNKLRFHPLTSARGVLVLPSIEAAELESQMVNTLIRERVEQTVGGITGKIVRLVVNAVGPEAMRHLDFRQIRKYRAEALNFSLELVQARPEATSAVVQATKKTALVEQVREFSNSWTPSQSSPVEVVKLVEEYLVKVDSEYETNQSET